MLEVVLATKKSLKTMNCIEIQVLARSEKEREHLLTPEFRCWREVGACTGTAIKTKQNKTVTIPVKPLQIISILEPRIPQISLFRRIFFNYCCILTVSLIVVQRLEYMATGIVIL